MSFAELGSGTGVVQTRNTDPGPNGGRFTKEFFDLN